MKRRLKNLLKLIYTVNSELENKVRSKTFQLFVLSCGKNKNVFAQCKCGSGGNFQKKKKNRDPTNVFRTIQFLSFFSGNGMEMITVRSA